MTQTNIQTSIPGGFHTKGWARSKNFFINDNFAKIYDNSLKSPIIQPVRAESARAVREPVKNVLADFAR